MFGNKVRAAALGSAALALSLVTAPAFAVTAAAANRRATGKGAELRLALSDVAFSMLSHLGMLAEAELLDQERPSLGNYIYGAFGRDFSTLDGARIFVAAISLGQWKALVKACDLETQAGALAASMGLDFAREGDRYEARERIAALVEYWCASRPSDRIADIFKANNVCWGRYQTVRQTLAADPRVSDSNPVFERIETAGIGHHLAAGTSVRIAGVPRGRTEPAPVLGQDTDQILMEVLRLDAAAVGKLHDAGVVAGPSRDPLPCASASPESRLRTNTSTNTPTDISSLPWRSAPHPWSPASQRWPPMRPPKSQAAPWSPATA